MRGEDLRAGGRALYPGNREDLSGSGRRRATARDLYPNGGFSPRALAVPGGMPPSTTTRSLSSLRSRLSAKLDEVERERRSRAGAATSMPFSGGRRQCGRGRLDAAVLVGRKSPSAPKSLWSVGAREAPGRRLAGAPRELGREREEGCRHPLRGMFGLAEVVPAGARRRWRARRRPAPRGRSRSPAAPAGEPPRGRNPGPSSSARERHRDGVGDGDAIGPASLGTRGVLPGPPEL